MLTILLNDQPYQTEATNLAELASQLQLPASAGAALYQDTVVPQSLWPATTLIPAARVSFFQLVAGG